MFKKLVFYVNSQGWIILRTTSTELPIKYPKDQRLIDVLTWLSIDDSFRPTPEHLNEKNSLTWAFDTSLVEFFLHRFGPDERTDMTRLLEFAETYKTYHHSDIHIS